MKKYIKFFLIIIPLILLSLVSYNYIKQDHYIFRSLPLSRDFAYQWDVPFDEIFIPVGHDGEINALHFHSPSPKGAILFLHGQGKNLHHWGDRAHFFLERNYDVMIIDYRGFGKSSKGFKENWLLEDAEAAYHHLLESFSEDQIVVYGQSLGTAMGTWVASQHQPKMLILEAPYYSMIAAAAYTKPFLPKWIIKLILKYPLKTNEWIKNVKSPIYIFHGTKDLTIPFVQARALYNEIKHEKDVEMIILPGWGHGNIPDHVDYLAKIAEIL